MVVCYGCGIDLAVQVFDPYEILPTVLLTYSVIGRQHDQLHATS